MMLSNAAVDPFVNCPSNKEDLTNCLMMLFNATVNPFIVEPEESDAMNDVFSLINGSQCNGLGKDQLLQKLSKSIDTDLPYKCKKIVVTEEKPFWNVADCKF